MLNLPVPVQSVLYSPNPKVHVYYPVVYGLPNPTVEQKINLTITQLLHQTLDYLNLSSPELREMVGYFELKTNERGILSLSLIIYSYAGGAHGITVNRSLTFDVTTGKQYTLGELFKPNSNYVAKLSAIVHRQIFARGLTPLEPFHAIKPDQDFYIADKALVIYFQLYELLPYVYGFPYFPISVYEIQGIIDEEGPLGKMIS